MDVERSDKKVGLAMNEAVDEDIANDKARGTAAGVLEDAFQVFCNADARCTQAVEDC